MKRMVPVFLMVIMGSCIHASFGQATPKNLSDFKALSARDVAMQAGCCPRTLRDINNYSFLSLIELERIKDKELIHATGQMKKGENFSTPSGDITGLDEHRMEEWKCQRVEEAKKAQLYVRWNLVLQLAKKSSNWILFGDEYVVHKEGVWVKNKNK